MRCSWAIVGFISLFNMQPGFTQQSADNTQEQIEEVVDEAKNEAEEKELLDNEILNKEELSKEELQKKQQENEKQSPPPPAKPATTKKVFKPSREISDDSPVAFPVDI